MGVDLLIIWFNSALHKLILVPIVLISHQLEIQRNQPKVQPHKLGVVVKVRLIEVDVLVLKGWVIFLSILVME